jgi:hypothetical protein
MNPVIHSLSYPDLVVGLLFFLLLAIVGLVAFLA